MKEFNLLNNIPKENCNRSFSLWQIETLDELSYAAYKASKIYKENQAKPASVTETIKTIKQPKENKDRTRLLSTSRPYWKRVLKKTSNLIRAAEMRAIEILDTKYEKRT